MASEIITAPDAAGLLGPLLPALPAAALSTQPAVGVLPLLSPILRQRVQLLASASTEPWLRLLCYDPAKAAKLAEVVRGGRLEPHPVSGEVEVDWELDAQIRYRRLDRETLQSLVAVPELDLAFQLVYCVGDQDGGGDGWRVGEVTVAEKPSPFSAFEGATTIAEADRQFQDKAAAKTNAASSSKPATTGAAPDDFEEDDDDDSYWGRYDATPARSPAMKRSPAPRKSPLGQSALQSQPGTYRTSSAEDAYFAQYDSVQPAMDNHDPDEAAAAAEIAPPLGLARPAAEGHDSAEQTELNETNGAWTLASPPGKSPSSMAAVDYEDDDEDDLARRRAAAAAALLHPRPESSASSNGSQTVAKLEETAGRQEQNEFGVKQHVGRSIRSLYQLSRASGIDRDEFERLVRAELDILGMVED